MLKVWSKYVGSPHILPPIWQAAAQILVEVLTILSDSKQISMSVLHFHGFNTNVTQEYFLKMPSN